MENKEQVIKVVLTPAGSEWSAEREYERLDYISNGKEVWVSIKVDAATGKNVGHPLTDAAWWNKCIDLSEAESLAAAATVAANAAATTANKAAQAAMDAKTATEAAVSEANKATEAANTATSAARVATTAANDATTAAEKVNAVLGDDNVLKVTDRTGAEKSLELVSEAAATEMAKQVEQNTAEIADVQKQLDMFGDAFVGFARVSGDVDPKPNNNNIYGDRKLVLEIGKHMKLGTVKRVGNEAVLQHECAPGRITKASNGEDMAADGSEGDLLVYIDMPLYMIKANQASGNDELSCMGVGVVPCYWMGHAAKKIEPFAISPFYTVNAKLEGDERSCAHCVINDKVMGAGQLAGGALKETFRTDGGGYYNNSISGINSIQNAQNKNIDPKTNYPYMGGYYEFFELWLMMMYVECGTLDTHDIYCMGVGDTQTTVATEATWCDEKIAANSGVKLFKADGTCVGYGGTNAILFKYNSDKLNLSGLGALVGAWYLPHVKCGETLTVLDGITKAGLQDKIGKASSVFYSDASGNMVCSEDGSVNVTTGEGMEANKRYYIVRDVPHCQGLGDGVMTAVVNCYMKMNFSDGVATNDVDLTGGYILYKFSHSVYRGFSIPMDGHFVQLDGAFYTTSKKDGVYSNTFSCAEKWQNRPPLKDTTSYVDIDSARSLDIMKGLTNVRVVSGAHGSISKADYSNSIFCYTENQGRGIHYNECCFMWNSGYIWGGGTSDGLVEEGKFGIHALAVGCSANNDGASARTAHCNSAVSDGAGDYAGALAVPQLKFKP